MWFCWYKKNWNKEEIMIKVFVLMGKILSWCFVYEYLVIKVWFLLKYYYEFMNIWEWKILNNIMYNFYLRVVKMIFNYSGCKGGNVKFLKVWKLFN